jgi:hypothetical protein
LQQSVDDSEVAVLSSQSDGVIVIGRRIEHRVSQQTIDDVDVAVRSGPHKGDVCISIGTQLARFEHTPHKHQSTVGSVIAERLKTERHG